MEGTAAPILTVHIESQPKLFHEAINHGQAETAATRIAGSFAGLAALERLKNRFLLFFRDARTRIGDRDIQSAPTALFVPAGSEIDAAARRIAHRINKKIRNDPAQACAVTLDLPSLHQAEITAQGETFLLGGHGLL